jgi:hypothetical protein
VPDGENQEPPNVSGGSNEQIAEWTIWPLKESFLRSLAVVLFLSVIVWSLYVWFGPQWILPSAFILILFLSGFFLPTFYRLDSDQVSVRGLLTRKKRRWSDFKAYYEGKKGIHLSTTERPSKLEGLRGIYLPFGPEPSEERRRMIIAFIERKLDHERSSDRAAGTAAGETGP